MFKILLGTKKQYVQLMVLRILFTKITAHNNVEQYVSIILRRNGVQHDISQLKDFFKITNISIIRNECNLSEFLAKKLLLSLYRKKDGT